MSEGWTRTTCPYCGVGCGVLARPAKGDRAFADIKGDPEHPANFGRLCSKGASLGETLSLEERLLKPSIHGRETDWDEALDLVTRRFADTIAEHGPDSVALYVSGQILTEDYYVANKLMKGFVGSANIDTNSRLCMASSVAGHKRAFGTDTVPGLYEDLECADLVVLTGSNLAWCHPVLFQRLSAAREERGTKVVVIDPRRTATCEIADLHLGIAPGSDAALFNGLLAHLAASGRIDEDYIAAHTSGFPAALAAARSHDFTQTAALVGCERADIIEFYELFATTERTVTVYSQGVNQSSSGTDKVNAIINCHLATGRIGRPGMGPFSVTGQPNAMGGREVGGLANMLAAHMELANPDHRRITQTFWQSPHMPHAPGHKAVDLFRAVGDGRIKALWIMATNPVDSMPEANSVRAAIEACPFVVVSDVTARTDTARLAHVLLPAAAWGEKDGTVTNSERRISRQRSFLPLAGAAKPDWWQLAEVGKRLGYRDAFSYAGPADIFAEYARLTGTENAGTRDLDISAYEGVEKAEYETLAPFVWPQPAGGAPQATRFFAEGGFFTDDGRGRFIAVTYQPPASKTSEAFPFVLNTGRIRDQWHTMTRTGSTARLMSHISEPFVEMSPLDARAMGIAGAQLAIVESAKGSAIVRVAVTARQQPGSVFVPMHWTEQFSTAGRIDAAVFANTDPHSGQPESKHTPVRVRAFDAAWYLFAVMRQRPAFEGFAYGALARAGDGFRLEAADGTAPASWETLAATLLNPSASPAIEVLAYRDASVGQYRFAAFEDDWCVGLLYAAKTPVEVSRTWAVEQLGATVAPDQRLRLLAGRPSKDVPDRGQIVCSCFDVGLNEIVAAIFDGGCDSVAAVGACVKAGTNCGSCRSEIGRLLNETRFEKAV